jgi:immunity protein Imm5 of predicted polymorphic toxin system
MPDEPTYADRLRIRAEVAAAGTDALLHLEEICARRAHPVWHSRFPHDDEPMTLLEHALRDRDPALTPALNVLHTKLDDVLGTGAFTPAYAGFACLATARHAVAGEIHDQPAERGELDVPPTEWTPCYLASIAVAGGATWEPDTDAAARRAYWRWYTEQAVPWVSASHRSS